MLTNEDREIVRKSVMLPIILQMLDKDDELLAESKQTFRPLFQKAVFIVRKAISDDLVTTKRELSKRGIRVYDGESGSGSRKWRIVQRGYEETMEILRPTIRADVSERIAAYIDDAFSSLKPAPLGHSVVSIDGRTKRDGT